MSLYVGFENFLKMVQFISHYIIFEISTMHIYSTIHFLMFWEIFDCFNLIIIFAHISIAIRSRTGVCCWQAFRARGGAQVQLQVVIGLYLRERREGRIFGFFHRPKARPQAKANAIWCPETNIPVPQPEFVAHWHKGQIGSKWDRNIRAGHLQDIGGCRFPETKEAHEQRTRQNGKKTRLSRKGPKT